MTKLSPLWAGLALASVLVPDARGGDYHVGPTLVCGDCHVMHRAEEPAPAPVDPDLRAENDAVLPREERAGGLLREDVNDLCLSCHDGSSRAADVLGHNEGSSPGAIRQAGYLNRLGGANQAGTGHTLGSNDMAPGSSPPWQADLDGPPGGGLDCIHCHLPHGRRAAYRNLRADAGNNLPGEGLVTYNDELAGRNDLARDVFVRRARDYDESAVDFNEPDATDSAMARFCAGCHGEFHGVPGSKAIGGLDVGEGHVGFVRHPASGVDIGGVGGELSSLERLRSHRTRVKVMSSSASWSALGPDLTPTCITCHKAHGNGNPFALILRSGRGAPTEDGDTDGNSLEDLCGQCHVQASPLALP